MTASSPTRASTDREMVRCLLPHWSAVVYRAGERATQVHWTREAVCSPFNPGASIVQEAPDGFRAQLEGLIEQVRQAGYNEKRLVEATGAAEGLERAARSSGLPGAIRGALFDAHRSMSIPEDGPRRAEESLRKVTRILDRGLE